MTNRRDEPIFEETVTKETISVNWQEDVGSKPDFLGAVPMAPRFYFIGNYDKDTYTYLVNGGESVGVIKTSKNLTFDTTSLTNKDSTISATGSLTIGDQSFASAVENDAQIPNVAFINASSERTNYKHLQGSFKHEGWRKCGIGGTKNCDVFAAYTYKLDKKTDTVIVKAPSIITGGAVAITARIVTNAPVSGAGSKTQTTGFEAVSELEKVSSVHQNSAIAKGASTTGQAANEQSVATSLDNINPETQDGTTTTANGLQSSTLDALRLPNNALFTYNTSPAQGYLIETNSRFTDRDTFLSSDYMLTGINVVLSGTHQSPAIYRSHGQCHCPG